VSPPRPPYLPDIRGGTPHFVRDIGGYRLVMLRDVESPGPVEYLYVLAAFRAGERIPCLCVASEKNAMAARLGGGSHFLGVFPGEGHLNFGASDDWGDLARFTERALAICRERLALPPDGAAAEAPAPPD